jgi:hypothetical protein
MDVSPRKRQRRNTSKQVLPIVACNVLRKLAMIVLLSARLSIALQSTVESTKYRHRKAPKEKNAALQHPMRPSDSSGEEPESESYQELVAPFSSSTSLANAIRVIPLPMQQNAITAAAAKAVSYRYESIGSKSTSSSSSSAKNAMMLLQSSPCYPEEDGYFGATHVPPRTIQYGFEMQAYNDAVSNDALTTIRNMVSRNVIGQLFPTICGSSNNQDDRDNYNSRHHRMLQQTLSAPYGVNARNGTSTRRARVIGLKFVKDFMMDIDGT